MEVKRKREEDAAASEVDAANVDVQAKKAKSDAAVGADAAEAPAVAADPAEAEAIASKSEENQEIDDQKVEDSKKSVDPVKLGPKVFNAALEMFGYFYDLLHDWRLDHDFNEYEHMILTDLVNKGHSDPTAKIGPGITAFQVRHHPRWRSRCYYLMRTDGSMDDFSYRKCVDKLMPLPPELFNQSGSVNLEVIFGPGAQGRENRRGGHSKGGAGRSNRGGYGGGRGGRGGGQRGGRGGHRGRRGR